MAAPATQSQSQRGVAAAAAAVAPAAAAAVAATPEAAAGSAAAASSAIAARQAASVIMAAFVQWLATVREQHRQWLGRELAGQTTDRGDVADVLAREMTLEDAFARNAADRVASKLPAALAIGDGEQRRAAVRQVFADEERFQRQRGEAMAARALAALERVVVRRGSPAGAYWRLGFAHKHTQGCLVMAGRFWPWAVLDRVHPPRHYGCSSSLVGYDEAVGSGLMAAGDVPDVRAAVRAAAGVMMEGEAAALLGELDIRDALVEQGFASRAALERIPLAGLLDQQTEGREVAGGSATSVRAAE